MAYDEKAAGRVRKILSDERRVEEKHMFGGLAFMVRGHMCVGVSGEDLMVRVGPEGHADALRQSHARKMDFTGKPLKGFVFVGSRGYEKSADLRRWVQRALAFNRTLEAK